MLQDWEPRSGVRRRGVGGRNDRRTGVGGRNDGCDFRAVAQAWYSKGRCQPAAATVGTPLCRFEGRVEVLPRFCSVKVTV